MPTYAVKPYLIIKKARLHGPSINYSSRSDLKKTPLLNYSR